MDHPLSRTIKGVAAQELNLQYCSAVSWTGNGFPVLETVLQHCNGTSSTAADSHNHSPRDSHDHSPSPELHV
jgi:hypothetical protein